MIPPGQNSEEDKQTPNRFSVLSHRVRRLWETASRWVLAMVAALRTKVDTRPGTGARHRVPPKMRSLQLVAAAAAAGVLGVAIGNNTGHAPEQTAGPAPAEQSIQVRSAADVIQAPQAGPAPHANPVAAKPGPPPKDQLDAWIAQAHQVLRSQGYPADKLDPQDTRSLIENESGGDPGIVNTWDSNAQKGTPSKGLMQTIDPTFQAFSLPGHKDIFNPVDNIIAASRYSINDYGSISNVPGVAATKSGGSYQGY